MFLELFEFALQLQDRLLEIELMFHQRPILNHPPAEATVNSPPPKPPAGSALSFGFFASLQIGLPRLCSMLSIHYYNRI
jgi:hypothetical protein